MATTPESDRLRALNLELDKLVDKYRQLAAEIEGPGRDTVMMSVCGKLNDAQHNARRAVKFMEMA